MLEEGVGPESGDPLDELLRPLGPRSIIDRLRARSSAYRQAAVAAALLAIVGAVVWAIWVDPAPVSLELPRAEPPSKEAPTPPESAPPERPETSAGQAGASSPGVVAVHVAGQALAPGVVRVPEGSRVIDALEAAGGPTGFADVNHLNLARSVADGEWIYVPAFGERPPTVTPPGAVTGDAEADNDRINLNTASAADLEQLDGVGPATAEAIIAYRDENGPFVDVSELEEVRGIGPAKLEAIEPDATVGP